MSLFERCRSHANEWLGAWDRFWFTPQLPDILCLMRIGTGVMLVYGHCIWGIALDEFTGKNSWISGDVARRLHEHQVVWSYLWFVSEPTLLWVHHLFTLAVGVAFTIGFGTRIAGPLAFFLQLMYVHRLTGALFGFDQILTMLLMYLMLAPCGARFSLDACLAQKHRWAEHSRWGWLVPSPQPSLASSVAMRLLQIHLCVIYLFGGISKMRGESWWDGMAMWLAVSSYEYQSWNFLWIGNYPRLFALLTNVTIFWEAFYPALVWSRLTRPWVLFIAVLVHGGIAFGLGMITFGLTMILANAVFLSNDWIRQNLPLPTDRVT
jgi:hypothetical protein